MKNLSMFEKINITIGWVFIIVGVILILLNMEAGFNLSQQLGPLAFIILGISLLFIPNIMKNSQIGKRK